jgi:hypothetical protein
MVIEVNPHDRIASSDRDCLIAITNALLESKKSKQEGAFYASTPEEQGIFRKEVTKLTKLINIEEPTGPSNSMTT